ncbi:hypothetical protein LXL04_020505 [Taraxacum kok-saghyz]
MVSFRKTERPIIYFRRDGVCVLCVIYVCTCLLCVLCVRSVCAVYVVPFVAYVFQIFFNFSLFVTNGICRILMLVSIHVISVMHKWPFSEIRQQQEPQTAQHSSSFTKKPSVAIYFNNSDPFESPQDVNKLQQDVVYEPQITKTTKVQCRTL